MVLCGLGIKLKPAFLLWACAQFALSRAAIKARCEMAFRE